VSVRKKKPIAGKAPRARAARGLQRQRLIDACISALHIHGPSRTTVEKVVAIAKMSPGIVRFYFDSKAAMLVASLQFLAAEFEERVLQPVARLKSTPVPALELLVDLYLDPEIASPRKVSVWYAFWGEASSRQEYYDICGKKDESFAALVRELIGRLIDETSQPQLDADGVALGLIGVLEMLWQDFAFRSEEDIDRAAAKRRCMAYLRSIFPGRFGEAPGARASAPRSGAAGGFAGWVYGSPRAALLERDALFRGAWQIAAHAAQIPRAGDFVTADLGAERVVVVRDAYGVVHALRNSCTELPHALVVESRGRSAGTFRCRAHGVEFDFEGRAIGRGRGSLIRLGLHTADHLVWVGPPRAQQPPRRQGGNTPAANGPEGSDAQAAAATITEREIEVAANWKLLVEQWLEAVSADALAAASADSIAWSARPLEGGMSFSGRCYRSLVKDAADEPWLQRFVAPNQLLQWRPDGLTVVQAIPASPETSRLRLISVARSPEGPEARAGHYLAARLTHWTRATTRAVAESAQRGVTDFGYRAGPGLAPALGWFRRYLTAHVPELALERPPA
jgi:TetR/AcrR family transcriptional regulator, transcriptional repressor of bet genes